MFLGLSKPAAKLFNAIMRVKFVRIRFQFCFSSWFGLLFLSLFLLKKTHFFLSRTKLWRKLAHAETQPYFTIILRVNKKLSFVFWHKNFKLIWHKKIKKKRLQFGRKPHSRYLQYVSPKCFSTLNPYAFNMVVAEDMLARDPRLTIKCMADFEHVNCIMHFDKKKQKNFCSIKTIANKYVFLKYDFHPFCSFLYFDAQLNYFQVALWYFQLYFFYQQIVKNSRSNGSAK